MIVVKLTNSVYTDILSYLLPDDEEEILIAEWTDGIFHNLARMLAIIIIYAMNSAWTI